MKFSKLVTTIAVLHYGLSQQILFFLRNRGCLYTTLTLSILTLSRMTLSKVSISDILRNDYFDHFDTFKNDTFKSV